MPSWEELDAMTLVNLDDLVAQGMEEQCAEERAESTALLVLRRQFVFAKQHRERLSTLLGEYDQRFAEWRSFVDTLKAREQTLSMTLDALQGNADATAVTKVESEQRFVSATYDSEFERVSACSAVSQEANSDALVHVRTSAGCSVALASHLTADLASNETDPSSLLWHVWQEDHAVKKSTLATAKSEILKSSGILEDFDKSHGSSRRNGGCCLDMFVLHPGGYKRIPWDILSLLVVFYDIITLPLVAFDFDQLEMAGVLRVATMVFWTVDILVSLFSGFQLDDGYLELRFCSVASKYARTRLLFDGAVSGVDWLLFFGNKGNLAAFARIGKGARITRAMRLFRMCRIMRIKSLHDAVNSHVVSATLFTFLNIVRLVIAVMIVNHFFSCGWYGIARLGPGDLSRTWAHELAEHSMVERYLAAYRWCLSQFTPSGAEFFPVNARERLYALFMLFVGLIVYSSFLGSVTAIVNDARQRAFKRLMEGQMLRSFLYDNQISPPVAHAVTIFLNASHSRKNKVLECDVPSLELLPRHLREVLHFEIHAPIITRHAFFQFIDINYRSAGIDICHAAAAEKPLVKGEEPFFYQQKGAFMLFPIAGNMDYWVGPDTTRLLLVNPVTIGNDAWVTEAPLWIQWEHRGLLSVKDNCDVLEIDSYKFRKVVVHHCTALEVFRRYAACFANAILADANNGIRIDDLWGTPCGLHTEFMAYNWLADTLGIP